MQPNSKEFLAKKSTENNIGGNKGISVEATVEHNEGSCLVRATENMKQNAEKQSGNASSSPLANNGNNGSMLKS